jgi:CRISPR-associated endoribonuclease Cas6
MRFKIDLSVKGEKPYALPVNYQNEFSIWIHKMLHFGSKDFNGWIKQKGYSDPNGEYRLYTYSEIEFPEISHHEDRLILEKKTASFLLSFYAHEEIGGFIPDIFKDREFKIGDNKSKVAFIVAGIERIKEKDLSNGFARFTCVSPMLISEPGNNDVTYLSPDQKDFDKIFFKNLMFKYANLIKYMPDNTINTLSNLKDLKFSLLSKPKSKIIKIKTDTPHQKSVKCYLFDFEIRAPEILLSIGYNAGFGDLNNLGFGCCEVRS